MLKKCGHTKTWCDKISNVVKMKCAKIKTKWGQNQKHQRFCDGLHSPPWLCWCKFLFPHSCHATIFKHKTIKYLWRSNNWSAYNFWNWKFGASLEMLKIVFNLDWIQLTYDTGSRVHKQSRSKIWQYIWTFWKITHSIT